MATKTYALTTVARLKDRLGVTSSSVDTEYQRMIYSATDFIERACGGRRFQRTTYTNEIYDGNEIGENGSLPWLILRNGPLVSISAFEYRAGNVVTPSWTAFITGTYETDFKTSSLYVYNNLPRGTQNLRVSYVAGYLIDFTNEFDDTLHTLPFELSDLCERLATKLIKRRESEGRSQESFNNSSINWGDFIEAHDRQILANYRRVIAV